jgi:hypothetical protein
VFSCAVSRAAPAATNTIRNAPIVVFSIVGYIATGAA